MKNKITFIAGISLSLLPILIYYAVVYQFAINIPYADEYGAALKFIGNFMTEPLLKRILLLFHQANEHRIFSYSLTVVSEYKLLGEVNFRYIVIAGNLGMLGILYYLYQLRKTGLNSLLLFTPVVLLIMVPLPNITDWGIETICAIIEFVLVFASLSFLNKKGNTNFSIAVILAIIATFSFGNGMFTFLSGFFILLLKPQKSVRTILAWTFIMIVCIILYFIDFNATTSPYSKLTLLYQPLQGIRFFLKFFGAAIKMPGIPSYLITLSGLVILTYLSYLLIHKWKYFRENPLIISYLFFISLSAVTVTISRLGFGLETASADRYRLMPVLFISIIYISSVGIYKEINKPALIVVLLLSLIFYGVRLRDNYYKLSAFNFNLYSGIISLYLDPGRTTLQHPSQKYAYLTITKAISKGYYQPPEISKFIPEIKRITDIKLIPESGKILFCFDNILDHPKLLQITGWAFMADTRVTNTEICMVLKSPMRTFIFSGRQIKRHGVLVTFQNQYPGVTENCGFSFILDKEKLKIPPDKYQVGICITKNNLMIAIKYTDLLIDFSK